METQISLAEKTISVLCHGSITIEQADGDSYYCFKPTSSENLTPIYQGIMIAFDIFINYCYDKIVNN